MFVIWILCSETSCSFRILLKSQRTHRQRWWLASCKENERFRLKSVFCKKQNPFASDARAMKPLVLLCFPGSWFPGIDKSVLWSLNHSSFITAKQTFHHLHLDSYGGSFFSAFRELHSASLISLTHFFWFSLADGFPATIFTSFLFL